MNTTPNANNEFKDAFFTFFNKPGSPFQGANITIEKLTIQMPVESIPGKEGGTEEIFSLKQTPASEVAEGLSSALLSKKIVELNVSGIIVFLPSGGVLHEVDVEDCYEQLVASTIAESLETFEVGTRFSVLYNRGPIGIDSRQWIKTPESTWTPSVASEIDDEAILIYISGKQKRAQGVKVTVQSEPAPSVSDVIESAIELEKASVSESIALMMRELDCSFVMNVYAIGDNGYIYFPGRGKKGFTLDRIKEFERDTIIVGEIQSYHKGYVVKSRWQKANKDQWKRLVDVTEKSFLERSVFESNGSMEFDSNQVSSLNILESINHLLELTKKFPDRYPFEIKAINYGVSVIALHTFESKGYPVDTPESAEMMDKLDGYSIGTRVVFTNKRGSAPTAIVAKTWVKIGEDNWYVMPGFDAHEHLINHGSFAEKPSFTKQEPVVSESIKATVDKEPKETQHTTPNPSMTKDGEQETAEPFVSRLWAAYPFIDRLNAACPAVNKEASEILPQSKLEGFKVVTAEEVVKEVTSGLGIVFAAKANEAHSSQVCTCKQFNEQRALALSSGSIVASASHLDAPQPDSDVIWLKGSSLYWIRMPRSAVPFPVCQAS